MGPKTFEQAAGFLRIMQGENPLDASAVHPEAYPVVERILADLNQPMREVMGNAAVVQTVDAGRYTDERFGLPTVRDILRELEKPGRDPRPEFRTATFKEGVEALKDLQPGMLLEGVVTNVTNFGAFVDVGVHQDGLVHISALSNKFVKDPRQVVKAGDVVQVKVLEVDEKRKRIALSMRLEAEPQKTAAVSRRQGGHDGSKASAARDGRGQAGVDSSRPGQMRKAPAPDIPPRQPSRQSPASSGPPRQSTRRAPAGGGPARQRSRQSPVTGGSPSREPSRPTAPPSGAIAEAMARALKRSKG
jgi:uncharacterized protein